MISTIERRSPAARRVRQHLGLFTISAALLGLFFLLVQSDDTLFRLSMATAYASMALLVYGLVLGPINVVRGRPNPVSTNLRRDAGIWAGVLGLLHVVVGLQVHLRGRMLEYFVDPKRSGSFLPLRLDAFGLANYTGLFAALILILLLSISNDISLRRLGTDRWKTLQRTNYVGMALVLVHGIVYQVLEKRLAYFVVIFGLMAAVAITCQFVGYRATLREKRVGR